jgi:K+-transporting ATPase c subunit
MMEDGFPLFDPNDEASRQEERLREYYEEFSANARRKLLSKTITRPTTVYDVLYPQTREALLSKNVPFNTDLEESSKEIRDRLVAKLVVDETDLDKISENFRKSLLARAKIQDDNKNLSQQSDIFRKDMISKNVSGSMSIDDYSEQARIENKSKNRPNLSLNKKFDDISDASRTSSTSKNVPKGQDLLRDSEFYRNQFRKNDINKNVPSNYDFDKNSAAFRRNNLSKNAEKEVSDLLSDSKLLRDANISKNAKETADLESLSEGYRDNSVSKNVPKSQDLLKFSDEIRNQFRKNDINKNVPSDFDIERDSSKFRRDNLAKNVKNRKGDLQDDSDIYRKSNLNKNSEGQTTADIDLLSEEARLNNTSKNLSRTTDLEKDSIEFRKGDLSLNVKSDSDLESESNIYRKDDLSNNRPKTTDLESESSKYRADDLSLNVTKVTDIQIDSVPFRDGNLSLNKPVETNIQRDSVEFRFNNLSNNEPKTSNLETDSVPFRLEDLSNNNPRVTDLETDSVPFRKNVQSFNKPRFTDLEVDSVPFRESDLSFNAPKFTNLETDSVPYRLSDLSYNVPIITDLEDDSIPFREDDLSFNVPIVTNLIVDSTPYLYNNLSSNIPIDSDLEVDSIPFRDNLLSNNVPSFSNLLTDSQPFRDDNLSSNVSNTGDLATDSIPFRNDNLSSNIPIGSNLLADSIQFREDNLSSNISVTSDLLTDSADIRDSNIAKNAGFGLLGVNIDGAGTSAFLGISRVFTQGILVRTLLLSKNKPKNSNLLDDSDAFRENNKLPNRWQVNNNEYANNGQNATLASLMQGDYNNDQYHDYNSIFAPVGGNPVSYGVFSTDTYRRNVSTKLQQMYGTSVGDEFPSSRVDVRLNTAYYSVDTVSPNGGGFINSSYNQDSYIPYVSGYITYTIKNYNIERNAFNLEQRQTGDPSTLATLQEYDAQGFQDLISKTIGSFKGVFQTRTLTTPADIIQKNGGTYYNGGNRDTDIMRPGAEGTELGSAESMMGKTAIGNPFEDSDFLAGRRGVRHVVNTIKSSSSPLAANFDPQNNRVYITGKNEDGTERKSRQKFTIANPYAPSGAKQLVFYLRNYANKNPNQDLQEIYLPPYIKSIQNTETANWNTVDFLGRPESVYTYNTSNRSASISFYILTDYTQRVVVGTNWGQDNTPELEAFIDRHITNPVIDVNLGEKNKTDKELQERNQKNEENVAANSPETSENQSKIISIQTEANKFQKKVIDNKAQEFVKANYKYSETNSKNTNTYADVVNGSSQDTLERIRQMNENFIFQPAYFSGDKVDFITRMEFLSKMTRPANAFADNTGFSFTSPPVCHIKLGTFWDHDIIVNSVSFDYTDAPWTLDDGTDGMVQPMWALVTIDFNIIGPYGGGAGRPPLAGDIGGMYSKRTMEG